MEVYKPREDSYLLAEQVKKYAKQAKKILDIGTGSGIQAITAKQANPKADVWACDINPKAISLAKKNSELDIKFIQSNLFENITENFDLIIFNTPYLPPDLEPKDIQWSGGAELINKFLKQAKKHLSKDGKIIFLFSSLTHLEGDFRIIAEKTMLDGEKLFVGLIEQ